MGWRQAAHSLWPASADPTVREAESAGVAKRMAGVGPEEALGRKAASKDGWLERNP